MYRLPPPKRYRKKQNWASNFSPITYQSIIVPAGKFLVNSILVTNPEQGVNAFNQKMKVKNIECSFQFEEDNDYHEVEQLAYFIMYIPQDTDLTDNDYVINHPEYVMAYKFIGSPDRESSGTAALNNTNTPVKIKSRLARNLNPGDTIRLIVTGLNQSNSNRTFNMSGLVKYVSKAN